MHPWQSARDEFEKDILPILEQKGKEIGLAGRAGNETAQKIMKYYSMLYKSFDPITLILLKEELKKYDNNF